MTSTELARHLSDAMLAYQTSPEARSLARLMSLAREAAAHVHRVGEGTVDHIVLASVLKLVVARVPAVAQVLEQVGWCWLP